jgi:hypothetical protein
VFTSPFLSINSRMADLYLNMTFWQETQG